LLAEAGFADARAIQGGMTAWHANGWPVADAGQ
jgi:rhodanese-related sulfurtransferase